MSTAVLILCTTGRRDEADRIAAVLVEERLAACVQITAIDSWYRWGAQVEHAPEYRLDIKTSAARSAAVEARLAALHSYDVPEIVSVPITPSAAYLTWLTESVA